MTFNQYIDNPLGKNNAVFSQRGMFKDLYTGKFNTVFLREAGKIEYVLMYDKKKDHYYIHIKIPSEVVPRFYYDVVVMFFSESANASSSNTLKDYSIKVYSNDPSFCFTYLRVFLKNDMFIEELKSKAPKLALKEDPKVKNPHELIGYVKSLYFTYLFMKNKNLFTKFFYQQNGIPFDNKILLNSIIHAEEKIAERQEAGERLSKEKKKQRRGNTSNNNTPSSNTMSSRNVSTTPTIGPKTNGIKSVKRTSRISKKK